MKLRRQYGALPVILLTMSMISGAFVTASSSSTEGIGLPSSFSDIAELPEWSVGNFWIYDMHFDFVLSGVFGVNGMDPDKGITNMKVEVIDINENTNEYTLDIDGDLLAQLEIFGIGLGTYDADVEGTAHIDMSTLAIKDFEFSASGEYKLLVARQTDVTLGMTFTPSFDFFNFPIDPDEEPWNADTYANLYGHIFVDGLYNEDFSAEGAFENETISFVKREDVTVPGGTFDSFLISGAMGPSHGGWSKLWYSPDARYLVKVDEKIEGWEGVDAQLDLELKATNCNTNAILEVIIHRIKMLDEIEVLPEYPGADWSYKLSVDDGENWIYEINDDYSLNEDDHTEDVTYQFNLYTTTPRITIKVWDRDFWSGDDLADVSGREGGGIDNSIPDLPGAIFHCKYDITEDIPIDNDTMIEEDGYYTTSGDYLPDGSTGSDENDAKVWFTISDDYERPQKPNKPVGPASGKIGTEYTYSTSAANPNENQRFYKWDWGDETYSDWLGPYNADEAIEASHTWSEKGSYEIKVKAKDVYDVESEWSDPLPVSMPKARFVHNSLFLRLLERFPNAFPILRHLLEL